MVLNTYDSSCFTVETGLANAPATKLYLKLGFRKTGEYDTDHGVRKVQFELSGTADS
jgi:RimJ/RimL family protein N-acetyltransferase